MKKKSFLRQFTARSSWYVIENKARQKASFIFVLDTTVFFFFFCFIDPAESAYLRIPPKKLLMPLVYYHEHGVKQKKTGTNGNNGNI